MAVAGCAELSAEAAEIAGGQHVHADATSTALHSYDASLEAGRPDLVVAPQTTDELRALVAAAHRHRVPFVMRGAGTGYSGGALPSRGGMVILTAGLSRILETDFDAGLIRCEPGVVLATVHRLAEEAGWLYLPDPSSHQVCTIGGNVAENAGGPHALGGGPTSNYVIAVDLIRPDGGVLTLGEQEPWDGGLDLRSVVVGSEGTLGAVGSVTLRLLRQPERARVVLATFGCQEDALCAVTDAFGAGLLPSALDMLTGAFIPGRSAFADPSLLFAGLQGREEEVAVQVAQLASCVRANHGSYELLDIPRFLQRRAELVRDKVRRMVAASGCPRYYLFDAVAPRSRLATLMAVIRRAARDYGLPVLNTFHAGDGNVHPTPFYDPETPGHQERLRDFSAQILRECAAMGGALSGEHGVGLEKQALMPDFYPREVLAVMRGIKRVFDPDDLCNPGKILPAGDPPAAVGYPAGRPGGGAPGTGGQPSRRPPCLDLVDALVRIDDPLTTFAEVGAVLAESPYELPYEPLGGLPGDSVLSALDAGLPGMREAGPARARDLILGAELHRGSGSPLLLGGTVAKDVGGYELRKLVYGGRGRLGALRRAWLRLIPRTSDSRLVQTTPGPVAEAARLCARLQAADLPFSYLGILLGTDGAAMVTGRLDLRGGTLDRHLAMLRGIVPAKVTHGDRWHDPPMRALAGGELSGMPGLPWQLAGTLADLAARGIPAFASAGQRRMWHAGPAVGLAPPSLLADAVAAAFRAAPR